MNTDSTDKGVRIERSLKELFHLVEELEQQVRGSKNNLVNSTSAIGQNPSSLNSKE